MIDETTTLKKYRHKSTDLAKSSREKVVAVCDVCGHIRDVTFRRYSPLCHMCACATPEYREKHSVLSKKMWEDPEYREKMSGENNPMKCEKNREKVRSAWTPERRENQRKIASERFGGENNPSKRQDVRQKIRDAWTPERIENMSGDGNPMKCDASREKIRGENNHNWKGGITKIRSRLWASAPYKAWRKAVFVRDGYTCQMCNIRCGNLQVHHILPVRDNYDTLLIFDVNNGITLCKGCHDDLKGHEYDYVQFFNALVDTTFPYMYQLAGNTEEDA